ncbi:MAG: hemolysin family protein [Candidatus Omnitrophica bacterium]|nr:hemolysin family protein [Candidatus Omnitrophota bacterium]
MGFLFAFILIIILTIISFFLSSSETAIIGLSKIRLKHLIKKGIKQAFVLERLITKLDKFITAILIGNNFVNIAISSLITAGLIKFFGYRWGVISATILAAFFILILCEITPKLLSIKHGERIALFSARPMEILINLLSPLIKIFTSTANFILKILGIKPPHRLPLITEEELRLLIEIGKEEGVLTEEERTLLHRIFEFGDTEVADVMITRDKIVAVDIDYPLEKVLDILSEEGHARIPVYKYNLDNIVGILYVRDLLYILRNHKLFLMQDIVSPPYFVLPTKKINELLKEFQLKKIQIAIVRDINQRTLGLVTLEDLIEEIVGEIEEVKN